MTGIGQSIHTSHTRHTANRSWADRLLGAFLTSLCNWLCFASRGYLCCPESCHERHALGFVAPSPCCKEKTP